MAYITRITTQVKNNERLNIYIDNGRGEEFGFSVDQNVFVKFQLKKGMEIDELDFTEVQFEDEVKKAQNLALQYLSYRMRSEKEVTDYLLKKSIDEPTIKEVMHQLRDFRYINDEEFAIAYVRTQCKTTSKGPQVIRQELNEKGIEEQHLKTALKEFPQQQQIETAVKVTEKIIQQDRKLSQHQLKQKIEQTLQRKGFPFSIINIALEEVEYEKDAEEEWEALKIQGYKAHNRYRKFEGWEYLKKMKQALYRKGFAIEQIERFIQEIKEE